MQEKPEVGEVEVTPEQQRRLDVLDEYSDELEDDDNGKFLIACVGIFVVVIVALAVALLLNVGA